MKLHSTIQTGSMVMAISGREKGEVFIVLNVHNNSAQIVNGKTRTLEKPKNKNIKHLKLLEINCKLDFKKLNNCDIIRTIKDYCSASKNKLEDDK